MTSKAYFEGRQAGFTKGSQNPYPHWHLETTLSFEHCEWDRGKADTEFELSFTKEKDEFERQNEMLEDEIREQPYLVSHLVAFQSRWNPAYPEHKLCSCGHYYVRHFDSYENMKAVGCKYCECCKFEAAGPYSDIPRVAFKGNV